MFNSLVDNEDLILKILGGLDEGYSDLCSALRVRESPISFDELHEKLINHEAHLKYEAQKKSNLPDMPASTNPAQKPFYNPPKNPTPNRPSQPLINNKTRPPYFPQTTFYPFPYPKASASQSCPYLGKCQHCDQQGHSTKRCSTFKYIPWSHNPQLKKTSNPSYPPRAHYASSVAPSDTEWLLNSGTSHHVTSDLQNLSIHSDYASIDNIMIRDGTGLPITHTSSTTLPSCSQPFVLKNVLCVPSMKKNLIFVSQFCSNNNVFVESLPCEGSSHRDNILARSD